MRYLERRGVRRVLEGALPDGRTSPNQIPVVDLVLALLAGVLTGSRRFAHVERLRSDEVVRTILGLARMPSAMTLTRYFGGFVRSQVEHLSATLGQFVFAQLKRPALGATLDLDSTVFERYGHQEGSLKGAAEAESAPKMVTHRFYFQYGAYVPDDYMLSMIHRLPDGV